MPEPTINQKVRCLLDDLTLFSDEGVAATEAEDVRGRRPQVVAAGGTGLDRTFSQVTTM